MTPSFAELVDPVISNVVDLLERINRNQADDVETERDRIEESFRLSDARSGETQDWQFAKYALVAWIDEVLKGAPWDGSNWWVNNSLEFAYYSAGEASVQFFVKAQEAAKLPRRDALEVFYVCVALGFRGLYHLDERVFLAEQLKCPHEIEAWAKKTASAIKLGQGRKGFQDLTKPIHGAPPLAGKSQLIASLLFAAVLIGFIAVLVFFLPLIRGDM